MTTTPIEVRQCQQYVGGGWADAADGRSFEDLDPYSGEVFAPVPTSTGVDAARAVDTAALAFQAWASTPPRERQRLLLAAAAIVERRWGRTWRPPWPGRPGQRARSPASRCSGRPGSSGSRPSGPTPWRGSRSRWTRPTRPPWSTASPWGWWPGSHRGTARSAWPGERWPLRWRAATR